MNWIKKLKLLRACFAVIKDPARTELIISAIESLATDEVMQKFTDDLKRDPLTKKAIESKQELSYYSLEDLATFAEGTLGHFLYLYYRDNKFSPVFYPYSEDNELNWVRSRGRKTHDIFHAVTGFGVDVKGEIGVLAFSVGQLKSMPQTLVAILFILHGVFHRRQELISYVEEFCRGYLMGKKAKIIFGAPWKELMFVSIDEIRRDFYVDVRPLSSLLALNPIPNLSYSQSDVDLQ